MVDVSDFLGNVPTINQVLDFAHDPAPAPPPGTPTGTGNWLTAGLGSGIYGSLGALGQGGEAVARAVGASGVGDSLAAFAERQRNTAATYARPDLEASPWYSPTGLAYHLTQGLPMMAGIAGGAALATLGAPEAAGAGALGLGARALLGGSAAAFPGAVGENIQRAREEGQTVDQGTAIKALALGVPEAALQAALPVMGEGMIAGRIGGMAPKLFGSDLAGKAAVGAAAGAAVQAPAAAAGEALMQQMGDPNRTFAQRSQDIVNAALSGGVQGGVMGGIFHSFAKKPPADVTTDDLVRLTAPGTPGMEPRIAGPADQRSTITQPQLPPPGAPGMEPQLQPPQRFAGTPEPLPGQPAPDVVVPPAQPGQAIRALPAPFVQEGARPASGEAIPMRGPPMQGEPVPAPGELRLTDQSGDQRPQAGGVVTPEAPPSGPAHPATGLLEKPRIMMPDETTEAYKAALQPLDNQTLLKHAQAVGPDTMSGKAALEVIADRLGWKKNEFTAPSAESVREQIRQQDAENAAKGQEQAIAAQQTDQVKKATRGFLPDFLKPHLGDEMALKSAIFDEAQSRDANDKPLGSRLTAIAKSFGVLGDDGKLVDPRVAQEQADTARAQEQATQAETTNLGPETEAAPEQANPVPSRVLRDAIPEAHQGKWDALEALRKSLPDNLNHLVPQIDDLQSKLASPKRGEVSSIARQTRDIRAAVEGAKAVEKVAPPEAKAPEPVKPAAGKVVDETQGAKKFTGPEVLARVDAAKAQGPRAFNDEIQKIGAEALSKQDQAKANQRSKAGAIQERSAAPVGGKEQPKAGREDVGRNAQQAPTGEVNAPARAEVPSPASKGEIEPKAAAAIAKPLAALRKNLGTLMERTPLKGRLTNEKAIAARNDAYQATLNRLDKQQQVIGKALKSGDLATLRSIKDDHFDTGLTDEHYDNMDLHSQHMIDEQAKHIDQLLDAVKEATGQNHARSEDAFSSREPTVHDQAISDLIDKGASARDILAHIARNGSNSIRRTIAAKMLQMSKADPSLRFGTLDEAQRDHPTQRQVFGDYHNGMDRIRVFDKADLEHTMLHEFAHAATVKALDDPAFAARAQKLLDAAKAQMNEGEQNHLGMKNVHEFMAEALGNGDFADMLDTMKPPRGVVGSIWQGIKDFVRTVLGLPKNADSLLDHVEHLGGEASERVNSANTPSGMNHQTGLYARSALDAGDGIVNKIDRTYDLGGIPARLYKATLAWRTLDGIAAGASRLAPSLTRKVKDIIDRHNIEESMSAVNAKNGTAYRALSKSGRDLVDQLKSFTFPGIDPRRGVNEHTWLSPEQRKAMAPEIKRANDLYRKANANGGAEAKVYNDHIQEQRANGDALMASLHDSMVGRSKYEIEGGLKINPSDSMGKFVNDKAGTKYDARQSADFWRKELLKKVSDARQYIRAVETEIEKPGVKAEQRQKLRTHINELSDWERNTTRYLSASEQAPNFPLYREGNQFVAGKLVKNFDETHVAKLQAALRAKGFTDVQLSHNVDNNQIYIRTNGASSMSSLAGVFNEMAKPQHGVIEPGSIKSGDAKAMRAQHGLLPSFITNQIKAFENYFPERDDLDPAAAKAYKEAKQNAIEQMTQQLLDILPPSSASKLFAERQNVQGATTKMTRASEERGLNTARAIGNIASSNRMAETTKAMLDDAQRVAGDQTLGATAQLNTQRAISEAFLRDAQRQWKVEPSPMNAVRHFTHVMELGLSVPYALTLGTQVMTLSHAELSKHFGFAGSATALMKGSAHALMAMKAAFQGGDKYGFIMSPDKLKSLPPWMQDFLTHQDNMGTFNMSRTQWVYDGIHHEGKMRTLHDISGAWTLYSEMFPKLATAFAARELYTQRAAQGKAPIGKEWNDMHSFAKTMSDQSQMMWYGDLNPRAFGTQGVGGAITPLLVQFQGFRGKMLEKLSREFCDAIGQRGPEYTTQARRFMLSHMAAQTVLAGTMGLPAVGMVAGIYDRLADAFSGENETHDLKASYRSWLSTVFGNDMGEALAHGVPRFGGIDLSGHMGEDRLIPLTDFMLSKRKFEDNVKDQAFNATGSAVHLATKMVEAARDLTNGDYLEAMSKAMPEMARNVAEGEILRERGYTDKAGFKIPGGQPSGGDVAAKMLGFSPADEARYQEKERIASGIKDRTEFDQQNIMTHLARTYNLHDPAGFQYWMRQSQEFGQAHPGMMPPAGSFANYLREHARSAGIAGAMGTPLGVTPRDLTTRGMVSFGNMGDK